MKQKKNNKNKNDNCECFQNLLNNVILIENYEY